MGPCSHGWLAFEDMVDQCAYIIGYIMTASYSDSWAEIRDKNGKLTGGVNSWYICQAKTGPWEDVKGAYTPCYRIMESKKWDKKHDDPLLTDQCLYCSCGAKLKLTWGQIVETSSLNLNTLVMEKIYMKSGVPSWDVEGLRAMEMEENLAPRCTRDIYDKVQAVKVALSAFIVVDAQGHHRLDGKEIYQSLPEFKWSQIYNMHT